MLLSKLLLDHRAAPAPHSAMDEPFHSNDLIEELLKLGEVSAPASVL